MFNFILKNSSKDPDFVVTDVKFLVADADFSVSVKCAMKVWLSFGDEDDIKEVYDI